MTAHAPDRSLAEQFAPALARERMARASLFTTARGGALALSVFAHVAVVASGLHGGRAASAPAAPAREALVETPAPELEPLPPSAEPEEHAEPSLTHARAVAPIEPVSHAVVARAPASTAAASATDATARSVSAPSPAPLVTAAESAAPRCGNPAPAVQAAAGVNARPAQGSSVAVAAVPAPFSEREVDVAARLVAGAPPAYTASAEAAGGEASVPVELVIDETGGVRSAVVLGHVGYGLDEAALGAVRKYRFSPARRGGKVVAVRMRWVVRFELG